MFVSYLFVLATLIMELMTQDFRIIRLSKISSMRYQCIDSGCSAPTYIRGISSRRCQLACLELTNCRTIVFEQSDNYCELFLDSINQRGEMIAQVGILTMIVRYEEDSSSCK